MTNEEKLAIVLQLVNGLKANEWRRIKTIIDRQAVINANDGELVDKISAVDAYDVSDMERFL